jgi:hypothetical protein
MRAEEFAALLDELATLERSDAKVFGRTDEAADREFATSTVKPRQRSSANVSGDELVRLHALFDCSGLVTCGDFNFPDMPAQTSQGLLVAFEEADPIVIDASGVVLLMDHEDPDSDFVIARCAASGAAFLDALGSYLCVIRKKQQGQQVFLDAENQSTALAGGEEYRKFWRSKCALLLS